MDIVNYPCPNFNIGLANLCIYRSLWNLTFWMEVWLCWPSMLKATSIGPWLPYIILLPANEGMLSSRSNSNRVIIKTWSLPGCLWWMVIRQVTNRRHRTLTKCWFKLKQPQNIKALFKWVMMSNNMGKGHHRFSTWWWIIIGYLSGVPYIAHLVWCV